MLKIIYLSIVQGLTEFLPISSSGHLRVFHQILNFYDNFLFIDVMLHFGTLLAIVLCFHKKIFFIINEIFKNKNWKYLYLIIIACIPAFFAGMFLKSFVQDFFSLKIVGVCFVITAILLLFVSKSTGEKEIKDLSYFDSFKVGLMQAFAILPGISRSGFTLGGGLLVGLKKEDAFDFSFILAIPVILGASLIECVSNFSVFSNDIALYLVGLITSFIFGILGIYLFRVLVKNSKI
jgi:undecaprenyl-diphosphatase